MMESAQRHDALDQNGVTSMLTEARKLNGDMRCHIKNSSFSSILTGRFYQNNSMQSHVAKKRRLSQMKARRDELRKALASEDDKIKTVLDKLRQMRTAHREAIEKRRIVSEKGMTKLQSLARGRSARKKTERMAAERRAKHHSSIRLQSIVRGRQGRERARALRKESERRRAAAAAAVRIQSVARRNIAERFVDRERRKRNAAVLLLLTEKNNDSAATRIQTMVRGRACRKRTRDVISRKRAAAAAATTIQSLVRGRIVRAAKSVAVVTKTVTAAPAPPRQKMERRESSQRRLRRRDVPEVNDGPRKPFVVGAPRDITAASMVKASLFGRQPPQHSVIAVPDPCFVRTRMPITTGSSSGSSTPGIDRRSSLQRPSRNGDDDDDDDDDGTRGSLTNRLRAVTVQRDKHGQIPLNYAIQNANHPDDDDDDGGDGDVTMRLGTNNVIAARQRAAARVAGMERRMREAKHKVIAEAKAAAYRVAELEVKRKKSLRGGGGGGAVVAAEAKSDVSSSSPIAAITEMGRGNDDDTRRDKHVMRGERSLSSSLSSLSSSLDVHDGESVVKRSQERTVAGDDERASLSDRDDGVDDESKDDSDRIVTKVDSGKECDNYSPLFDLKERDRSNENELKSPVFDASFEEDFEESENDLEMLL
eukprot:CAMPEP_0172520770 /NCGR_PEP_ID=MMETSP1066-20121228/292194_1 /TAXON_ID=671091 /ORGANISM="Coscinodiscus wailesii, Strain CCMP2513" /LENGTH=649 /DNA_ID=CAMNT_0013303579 /DNA_START=257 /DNA_END=2206 /DNA_ORIENTATION=+